MLARSIGSTTSLLVLAGSLSAVLGGCPAFGDPGVVYRVPDWKVVDDNGRWYERDIGDGVRIRVYNAGFGGSFEVRVQIVNLGSEDVGFDGGPMYLTDRSGTRLPTKRVELGGCDPGRPVHLSPGARLEVRCGFSADLPWMPRDILAIQPGLVVGKKAITLTIPMTTRG